jgi:hypothetical protein
VVEAVSTLNEQGRRIPKPVRILLRAQYVLGIDLTLARRGIA